MHFIQGLCVAALASIALHSVTFAADIHKTADLSVHSHTVVAGDTLWDLSEKYLGDPLTYPQVKQANQIDNEHALQPGQELKFITARFYPGVVTGITGFQEKPATPRCFSSTRQRDSSAGTILC